MNNVFTPPSQIKLNGKPSIFLAGTIDMGNSEDWQSKFIKDIENWDCNIYNPRREEWDSSWKQEFENPAFYQQVCWELDALAKSDIIVMNFLPKSVSPISLLELGLFARSGKIYVCCPKEYQRSGNVQIVCSHMGIPLYETMEELLNALPKPDVKPNSQIGYYKN